MHKKSKTPFLSLGLCNLLRNSNDSWLLYNTIKKLFKQMIFLPGWCFHWDLEDWGCKPHFWLQSRWICHLFPEVWSNHCLGILWISWSNLQQIKNRWFSSSSEQVTPSNQLKPKRKSPQIDPLSITDWSASGSTYSASTIQIQLVIFDPLIWL